MRTLLRSFASLFRGEPLNRNKSSLLFLEELETRDVPALVSPTAHLLAMNTASPAGLPAGLSPAQVRHFYGFDQVAFSSGAVRGDGSGQTIAIVDAYDQPNIAGDLAAFDATYGVAAPPRFTKVNQSGGASLPPADPGWGLEISLDVEWAHAIAPGASILLVEASSNSSGDLLAAENYARNQPGVSVVSMSWGAAEFSGEASLDSYFTTPAGHSGVTFVASSGDSGSSGAPIWPSVSANVLAVGGTQLSTDGAGDYLGETGWSGSGGGLAVSETQPGYQKGIVTQSSTARAVPDVAYDASSGSPFAVYDTLSYGGWLEAYGTSAGAPQWSALVATADQGRVLAGEGTLDGGTQTLPLLYQLPSGDFHDVTSGSNGGYSAGPGYDLVTGRGTPVANLIVSGLVGTVSNPPSPAAPTVTVSDAGGPYNGGAFAATGSVTGVGGAYLGAPTFTYYSVSATGSLTTLASAPVNAGSYEVVGSYAGNQNYAPASASASFTITPATPAVTVSDGGGVANGSAFTATGSVTGVNGVYLGSPAFTYYSVGASGGLTLLGSAPAVVGNYEVVAAYGGSPNYGPASASAFFSVVPVGSAAATFEVADFSGEGVWRYSASTGWQSLHTADASQVAVDARGDVVGEFPGYGVWRYEDAIGWRQLTAAEATQVAIAGNGIVAAEFQGYGVWRFEDAVAWQSLHTGDASQVAVDARGDVAGEFPGYGVWRYEDATGWQQLTAAEAAQVAIAGNGIVAAEFSGYGVWRYEDATSWRQLTAAQATGVAVDASGDVAAEFSGYGVWRYEDAAGWQHLTTSDAAQVGIAADGAVAAEFSPWGVWLFDGAWQQLTANNASKVAIGA